MAELGQTQDPKALVPGDAGAITTTMWAMRGYGDSLREAGEGLARIDTGDGWTGEAAEQFRDRFDGEPRKWTEAGDCFHQAADALDGYANSLLAAQGEAAEAIRLWNEAQAETANAQAQHDRAVREQAAAGGGPEIPFHDPGESKRADARRRLADARERLDNAGNAAKAKVGTARDKAPDKPGFWSKVGDALVDVGIGTVNALASVGNAIINHPGDVATAVGGALLAGVSAGGEGVGLALDATGVGAVAGVPLNVVSTAGIAVGATMVVAATGDILHHAATDDRVEPLRREEGELGGKSGTKTDRLKEHLTERDLDAARRELNGEVVARKPNGQPWDHVDEVRNAQRGLLNRIRQLQRELGDTRLSEAEKAVRQSELSEASRLLDHSEGFVPRP